MEYLKFMFQNFWHFLGCIILLGIILNFIGNIWNRFWRHWNIRKHGYPANTDADGDFKVEKDDE